MPVKINLEGTDTIFGIFYCYSLSYNVRGELAARSPFNFIKQGINFYWEARSLIRQHHLENIRKEVHTVRRKM